MTNTIPVTVAVPVKNEERNLACCLSRLRRFQHVIVIDSDSDDATPQIAESHGAEVVQFKWNGHFPKKRNWLLMNYQFQTEWVMFLDADEIIDDAFCDEVATALQTQSHSGYWMNFTNYLLGKPLHHGDPQRKLALFQVGSGLYERIEEDGWSGLDMEVHEHPVIEGTIGEISTRIDHNDDRGISKFIIRHRDYALWEASRTENLRAAGEEVWKQLTPRQKMKYRNIDKWWFAWFYFLASYVGKLGFLDGQAGFSMAFYKLWYFRTIRLLLIEARMRNREKKPAQQATTAGSQASS